MNLATAIVVARANSARLPNKALLPFAGATLIGHKVRTLLRCKRIGRVVVGSDSQAILDEAARHGAATVRRDDYHCDEARCSANEMIRDMVERVPGDDDETYVWAHPTNPLVKPKTYERFILTFDVAVRSGRWDSTVSCRAERRHAWYDCKPLNHYPWSEIHKVAADLKPVLFQDGAIFIQSRKRWLETCRFHGSRPDLISIPFEEGLDIDTEADYRLALKLCESQSSVAAPRLSDTPVDLNLALSSA